MAGCGAKGKTTADDPPKSVIEASVTVRTEPVRWSTISESVDGLGRCEALPDHIATLTPAVVGHVHALFVKQGGAVKKGQAIVELDKAVAQADLAEKTATRDGLKATLTLLKSLPRTEERRANELAIEQAKVALEQARIAADRFRPLVTQHLASEQQLFDAERAVKQAVIHQETAEATLHVMMIGPRPEAIAEAEGKIKTADALVDFSRAHLGFHTISAPIDGVLDSLNCHPGQTISVGSPIGEVVDTRQIYAAVWLSPRLVRGVNAGQAAVVRLSDENADAGNNESMSGKVDFVGRVADPQTGNLPVRVLVENAKGLLAVGQSVQVVIDRGERSKVLQVPVEAVLDLGEGPVVGVVREGKSVVIHPKVGVARDGWVAVTGTDLKEGELVIVEGGYSLPEGTPVKIATNEPAKAVAQAEVRR
jgi:multidrug efflux pump subunit AcrA (membrane-fusion protein)